MKRAAAIAIAGWLRSVLDCGVKLMVCAVLAAAASRAHAQAHYPERSIKVLYGSPAGSDTIARLVADKLSNALGKPVIVENVTGAAGNIATERAAKARPDGYTIAILANSNILIAPRIHTQLSFDPLLDLVPITQLYEYPNLLVVGNDVPAGNFEELVALARAAPGRLTYGHSGLGSTQHISGELIKQMAHIDIQQLPYRGPQQILLDLMAGQIALSFLSPSVTLSVIAQGKIRPLAVTSLQRVAFLPYVPTLHELGLPGFQTKVWYGLFAPAGTPESVIDYLNGQTRKIMSLPEVRSMLFGLGDVPLSNSPGEFAAVIRDELPYWVDVLKKAEINKIK